MRDPEPIDPQRTLEHEQEHTLGQPDASDPRAAPDSSVAPDLLSPRSPLPAGSVPKPPYPPKPSSGSKSGTGGSKGSHSGGRPRSGSGPRSPSHAPPPDEVERLRTRRRIRQLGEGAQGRVFLVEYLNRQEAHKYLDGAQDASRHALREALNTRVVEKHPNIVDVYDVVIDPDTGEPFLRMEFIDGSSLAQVLEEEGILPVGRVLAIGAQVASALAAAHRKGVIHLDIKPSNLLLRADGTVVVSDFGIAAAIEKEGEANVGSRGTRLFMSPARHRGTEKAAARDDIWSFGVTLYVLATGTYPFAFRSRELLLKALAEPPLDPRPDFPHVSEEFWRLVQRMLREGKAGFASMDEVAREIERIAARPADRATAAWREAETAAAECRYDEALARLDEAEELFRRDGREGQAAAMARVRAAVRSAQQRLAEKVAAGRALLEKGDDLAALHVARGTAELFERSSELLELRRFSRSAELAQVRSTAAARLAAFCDAAPKRVEAAVAEHEFDAAADLLARVRRIAEDDVARREVARASGRKPAPLADLERGAAEARRRYHDRLAAAARLVAEFRFDDALRAYARLDPRRHADVVERLRDKDRVAAVARTHDDALLRAVAEDPLRAAAGVPRLQVRQVAEACRRLLADFPPAQHPTFARFHELAGLAQAAGERIRATVRQKLEAADRCGAERRRTAEAQELGEAAFLVERCDLFDVAGTEDFDLRCRVETRARELKPRVGSARDSYAQGCDAFVARRWKEAVAHFGNVVRSLEGDEAGLRALATSSTPGWPAALPREPDALLELARERASAVDRLRQSAGQELARLARLFDEDASGDAIVPSLCRLLQGFEELRPLAEEELARESAAQVREQWVAFASWAARRIANDSAVVILEESVRPVLAALTTARWLEVFQATEADGIDSDARPRRALRELLVRALPTDALIAADAETATAALTEVVEALGAEPFGPLVAALPADDAGPHPARRALAAALRIVESASGLVKAGAIGRIVPVVEACTRFAPPPFRRVVEREAQGLRRSAARARTISTVRQHGRRIAAATTVVALVALGFWIGRKLGSRDESAAALSRSFAAPLELPPAWRDTGLAWRDEAAVVDEKGHRDAVLRDATRWWNGAHAPDDPEKPRGGLSERLRSASALALLVRDHELPEALASAIRGSAGERLAVEAGTVLAEGCRELSRFPCKFDFRRDLLAVQRAAESLAPARRDKPAGGEAPAAPEAPVVAVARALEQLAQQLGAIPFDAAQAGASYDAALQELSRREGSSSAPLRRAAESLAAALVRHRVAAHWFDSAWHGDVRWLDGGVALGRDPELLLLARLPPLPELSSKFAGAPLTPVAPKPDGAAGEAAPAAAAPPVSREAAVAASIVDAVNLVAPVAVDPALPGAR